jgi:pimeloyl-ACP methyl ester carboxylesterase
MSVEPLACSEAGDGMPFVFVHGVTFSRHTWDPIVDRLCDRFRCLAVDLPGHGDSDGSAADPRTVVDRLHTALEERGVASPIMIGHSAGALTATGYAATHPVAGVVNVDQTMLVAPFAGFLQQLAPALRGEDFETAFAPFRNSIGVDQLPEPERTRVLATQRIDQQVVLDHWTGPLTMAPQAVQDVVSDLLDAVSAPYLWLAGHELPDADRHYVLGHVPQARIEEWLGLGHMMHLVEPDRFVARVAQFAAGA